MRLISSRHTAELSAFVRRSTPARCFLPKFETKASISRKPGNRLQHAGSIKSGQLCLIDNIGQDAYWILMAINFLGLEMVVLFWPETKGISLEHMDTIFGQVDMVRHTKGNIPVL